MTPTELQAAADYLRASKHGHFCPVVVHGSPCGVWECFGCEGVDEYYLECDHHFQWWERDPREDCANEEVKCLNSHQR